MLKEQIKQFNVAGTILRTTKLVVVVAVVVVVVAAVWMKPFRRVSFSSSNCDLGGFGSDDADGL